ncbi:hypothetical protein [Pollutibacter soli]|uniref:hypothetical protein n=1 Tax=Pollutibacter soli TaxID=3034157 RepID=UPI003013AC1A
MKNIFLSVFMLCSVAVMAQQPKPATTAAPKLFTKLGNQPGGNAGTDIIKRIVDSSVNVIDAKGVRYPVVGFTIVYYFMTDYMDEETQQKKRSKDIRSSTFDSDKLSEDWINSIKENTKVSDTLLINNVFIRMKDGKKRFAPNVKYVVAY